MRSIVRYGILGCFLAVLGVACGHPDPLPPVRDGDIIFQTSHSSQSLAIQRATGSAYSHMGLVFLRDPQAVRIRGSCDRSIHASRSLVARGVGHHFVVKRLRNADAVLGAAGIEQLRKAAEQFSGRHCDLTFDWSDDRIYCSELVWKAYDRSLGVQIGALQTIRDFNLTDPAVRAKLRQRYGDNIPLNEPVISPVSMFRSTLLVTVANR